MIKETCKKCEVSNCAVCDENRPSECYFCMEYNKMDSRGNCCDLSCLTCAKNSSECLTCPEGTYLINDYCYDCLEHCEICEDDMKCYKCKDGYELSTSGLCSDPYCDTRDCLECSDDYESCYNCAYPLILTEGNCCYDNCEECSESDPNCLSCYDDYSLIGNECIYCGYNCKSCKETYNCTKCYEDFTLINGTCEYKGSDANFSSLLSTTLALVTVLNL